MRKFIFPTWSVPIALLFASLLSFGLLIPWLGFYWDDWPAIWFLHFLGPTGFGDVFAHDRPLLGRLFLVTTSILGESILNWQIFGFLARWGSSLAFWWLLRILWPSRPQQAAWMALLFALYPGFSQQFIAVTYSHVFVVLTSFILSLVTMILGVRRTRWSWLLYLLSLLLSALSMFSVEYFFGLELLRPIFLWLEFGTRSHDTRKRIRQTILYWAPYLVIMISFIIWRIFLHETPRGQVLILDTLRSTPFETLFSLAKTILSDTVEVSLLAWLQTFNFFNLKNFGLLPTLLYAGIVLAATALFIVYLLKYRESKETDPTSDKNGSRRRGIVLLLIGLFGLLIAGWPFWSTGLPIELGFPYDRFTLAMMMGTSMLFIGLVIALVKKRLLQVILVGSLIGLAIGLHFQNANHYRREWSTQKDLFWQLAWRAPGLEPGTMILTSELPFVHYSDNSLTAPLNWTFAPDFQGKRMPYLLYQIESRLGNNLTSFDPGIDIYEDYRAFYFEGSTDQALVFYYQPPGCVQVLDYNIHARLPQKPKYISSAMPLSNINLIQPEADPPAQPPLHILGPEPSHDWCYYFEKADLARQQGNWNHVVDLGNQALQLDQRLYPVNAPEYLPFIEAYAQTGDWQRAVELTEQAFQLNFRMDRALCSTWERIQNTTAPGPELNNSIEQLNQMLKCSTR
jgi:hypothetical protein